MDLDQAGALPGRTASFGYGMNGTPGSVASSLNADSARFNDLVGREMLTPHSVLQGLPGMSGNGKSAEDAQRTLPGGYTLPSSNGISSGTYDAAMRLHMLGSRGF